MDMEKGTEDSDLLQTRPCVVVHACNHFYPNTEGRHKEREISKSASAIREPVFKRSGSGGLGS